jgi:hypothetical protein
MDDKHVREEIITVIVLFGGNPVVRCMGTVIRRK